ncbi:MAG TPA: hypothetical protein VJZ73_09015, partial [Methylomirabilota bacterium]|nr:hypothetical protein [Methylomirabilota bacterium]
MILTGVPSFWRAASFKRSTRTNTLLRAGFVRRDRDELVEHRLDGAHAIDHDANGGQDGCQRPAKYEHGEPPWQPRPSGRASHDNDDKLRRMPGRRVPLRAVAALFLQRQHLARPRSKALTAPRLRRF